LIEEGGLRILTDPGDYSTIDVSVRNVNVVLITHEHGDHIHIPSLKKIIENNPEVRVVTNEGVLKLLDSEGIKYEKVEDGQNLKIQEVLIEAIEGKHVEIYEDFGMVQNTGFFIGNKLFYPGDAFHDPQREVDVLALPVAGPWCNIADAIRYALKIKPRVAFPVHDGALKVMGGNHKVPSKFLPENGVEFKILEHGVETDF
jgi:L-ascorbate metabolism protein UlaG (beta-lactamase superfamily)